MHDCVILDSHVTRQEENDGEGRGSEILKSLEKLKLTGWLIKGRKRARKKESKKERREEGSITMRFGNSPKKCPLQLSLDLVTTTTSVYVTDLLTCPCSSSVQLPIVIYSGFKLNLSHPSQKSLDVWIVEQKYAWFWLFFFFFLAETQTISKSSLCLTLFLDWIFPCFSPTSDCFLPLLLSTIEIFLYQL